MQFHLRTARVVVAIVMLVVALAVLMPGTASAVTPTTVVKITVVKGRPVGGVKRPVVKKGAIVKFVVITDRGKEMHLHGYDVERALHPGKPAVIRIVAKLPGRFELEMHGPDALLAQLTVRP